MSGTAHERRTLSEAAAYFGEWIEFRRSALAAPGIQVALAHEGDLLLSAAYGSADPETATPLRTDSLFCVASQAKMLTATAGMQIVETGRLRLDDPIGPYVGELVDDADVSAVTVRELLSHGAGLPNDWPGGVDQLLRPFPDRVELAAHLRTVRLVQPRNEAFKYSNLGYALLGAVVEAVTGVPYDAYVTEHVLRPLGLKNTGPDFDTSRAADYATGYTAVDRDDIPRRPVRPVPTGALSPGWGAYGTASDLCRFAGVHFFGNETLLSDDSKRLMQRAEWDALGTPPAYGLGLQISRVGERTLYGHGGAFAGYTSTTRFDPRTRTAVAVLANTIGVPTGEMASTAFRLIDLAGQQGARTSAGIDLDRFCGRYINLWYTMDIVRFGDRLFGLWPDQNDPTDDAAVLEPVDERTLRWSSPGAYNPYGELMRFDFDGDAVRRITAPHVLVPIEAYRSVMQGADVVNPERPWDGWAGRSLPR